jgi:hypothetical protein
MTVISRMRRRSLFLWLSALCVCGPAAAQPDSSLRDVDIASLYIDVSDEDSNFTVIDARMDETMTAGVFFGIVGAGINSASNASQDDKLADTLREAAAEIDLKTALTGAIAETLSGKDALPLAADRSEASHTLLVEIRNWGLMRKSREDERMHVFLNLSLSVLDAKGKPVWEKKRENAVGAEAAAFEDFTGERLQSEMAALAEKSGKFVAFQIIYR